MTANRYNNVYIVIIAFLISIFLNQDRIIRIFYSDVIKHAVPIASSRIYLGDEYHYYVEANDSLKIGLISKDKVYSTNNVLLGSLFVSGVINYLCQILIPSSDIAVLFSLILQAFILAISTMYVLKVVGKFKGKFSVFWIGFWAFVLLILTDYFLLNSYLGTLRFRTLLSYYPNVLRVVNPQMGWAYGILYLAALFSSLSKKTSGVSLVLLCIMSLLLCFFSPSLCLTMLLAMLLFNIADYFRTRTINLSFNLLSICLLISFVFNYYQLHNFQISPKGMEIGTGVMKGIVFKVHYFILLGLIIPLSRYYKHRQFILLSSVLVSSILIGSVCESLYLGERLWLRGAGYYVWIVIIILISNWLKSRITSELAPAFGFCIVAIWSYFLLPHQYNSDYGYVSNDKWIVVDWINKNLPKNSIIMSEDLEFSFLLPIYSKSQPFVPLFSYSNLSAEDIVKKYFYVTKTYKIHSSVRAILADFKLEKSMKDLDLIISGHQLDDISFLQNTFYNHLLYYPFTKFSKSAFESEQNKQKFFSQIDTWSSEPFNGDKRVDYLIIKHHQLHNFEDNRIIFQSNNYMVLSK